MTVMVGVVMSDDGKIVLLSITTLRVVTSDDSEDYG